MIYTIGQRDRYEPALARSTVFKLGRQGDYPGGSVFPTAKAATLHLTAQGLSEHGVYGVDAEWGIDTQPSQDGPWHDPLRDAKLMRAGAETEEGGLNPCTSTPMSCELEPPSSAGGLLAPSP